MSASQSTKVLNMLRAAGKRGLENYKFPQAQILCYTKRISELRDSGHNILTERVYVDGRATGTFRYTLLDMEEKVSFFKKKRIRKLYSERYSIDELCLMYNLRPDTVKGLVLGVERLQRI